MPALGKMKLVLLIMLLLKSSANSTALGVNDNAYTNAIAQISIDFAIELQKVRISSIVLIWLMFKR